MASELKPCPFCSSTNVDLANTWTPSFWVECNECGAQVHGDSFEGPDRKDHFSYSKEPTSTFEATLDQLHPEYQAAAQSAIDRWNTRPAPAATDTGLVTVAHMAKSRMGWVPTPHWSGEPVCLCSQAEKLLAAERAEKEQLKIDASNNAADAETVRRERDALIANNAARDARIKELDKSEQELIEIATRNLKEKEAHEAKLAAAGKIAQEVLSLNAGDAGIPDRIRAKARAVLGGKP